MKYRMIHRGSTVERRLQRVRPQAGTCPSVQGRDRAIVRRHRTLGRDTIIVAEKFRHLSDTKGMPLHPIHDGEGQTGKMN